jgi:hypothetical protein
VDADDSGCVPGTDSSLVKIDGCFNSDEDFDGQTYRNDWPGTNPNPFVDRALHPTPALPAGTLPHAASPIRAVTTVRLCTPRAAIAGLLSSPLDDPRPATVPPGQHAACR